MTAGNVTYVRWRSDQTRRARVFPPLDIRHPAWSVKCLICDQRLGNGMPVQSLVIQEVTPAMDPERWISAEAVVVHEACLSAMNDSDVDSMIDALVPEGEQ